MLEAEIRESSGILETSSEEKASTEQSIVSAPDHVRKQEFDVVSAHKLSKICSSNPCKDNRLLDVLKQRIDDN